MATRLEALLDTPGLRPGSVTLAAVLGVVAGGVTLLASVFVVGVLVESAGASDWFVILAWMVAVVQVAAVVLLIVGGTRLALGAGRTGLVAGATLQLLICAVYLLYALTVVAHNTTEAPSTVVAMTTIPFVFAAILASSLFLALHPTTTQYLTLMDSTYSRLMQ